ncbi:MAG: aryl-sulfate sulfotransferase [Verrucomicrobiota bacterium]
MVPIAIAVHDQPAKGETGVTSESGNDRMGNSSSSLELQTRGGLLYSNDRHQKGYTLVAPMQSRRTFLVDSKGKVVHSWDSAYRAGRSAYLLEDGSILRGGVVRPPKHFEAAGGAGGRIQRVNWYNEIDWDFWYAGTNFMAHHDIEPMPNGNVLVLVWDYKTREDAIAAGRDPDELHEKGLWVDGIVELRPVGEEGADIVWKWSAWDHLVQDFDKDKGNAGDVGAHPGLIDFNYNEREDQDWIHLNSIDYNEKLDQIVVSAHGFNELWVIDHSTTTAEAATHEGGRCGRGGDLLYRWGNPRAYRAGTKADQQLFRQHDVRWIEKDHPGAGNLLIFNNGWLRPLIEYSSIEEIVPPLQEDGTYARGDGAYGPASPIWQYIAPEKEVFYAQRISGAQRLPNGNTLICSGPRGILFEVDENGEQTWQYQMPFGRQRGAPLPPGGTPEGPRPVIRATGMSDQPGATDVIPFTPFAVFKAERYGLDYPGVSRLKDSSEAD